MLQQEKLLQAKKILKDTDIDVWITLVRETGQTPDPILPLITTVDYTWLSALMVTKSGRAIAIVGNHDEEGTKQTGIWDEVYGYKEDFLPTFQNVFSKLNAQSIALNYSTDLPAADGLSHGLYVHFMDILNHLPFDGAIQSSSDIIRRLRGQKTPFEISCITRAIQTSQTIFDNAVNHIHAGMSEIGIFDYFQEQMNRYTVLPAWLPSQCPGVMAGAKSVQGHNAPTSLRIEVGDVITVDFGVLQFEYCSDLQRVYYVHPPTKDTDEITIPQEIQRAFDTVRDAIQAAADFLKPGVTGVEVDAVARDFVKSHGYPEWSYALGHEVGRRAHDGGAVLGPRWPRYKGAIELPLLAGNVFTLELGVPTSRGYVGLEEMVVLTDNGARFVSQPQQAPYIVY